MNRSTIISAIYSAVSGLETFSASTYWGSPQEGASLPNVIIRTTSDGYDEDNAMSSPEVRSLSVEVEVRDRISTEPSTTLDGYIDDIEQAIYTSTAVTSNMMDMVTENISFEYSDEGETPVAMATINLDITYEEGIVYSPEFSNGLYYNTLSATTFYSGSTDMADIISNHTFSKGIEIISPAENDTATLLLATKETTLTSVSTIAVGTSPSVEWKLYTGTNRSIGTEVASGTTTTTTTPDTQDVDEVIVEDGMLWVELETIGGTCNNWHMNVVLEE